MAPRRFLNRTEELASLQRRWDTGEAHLFTLWGPAQGRQDAAAPRVRSGQAPPVLRGHQRHPGRPARRLLRPPRRGDRSRRAERAGLAQSPDAVADWARDGPVLLVLDEFQFLARENGDIGSVINVWWRERGEELSIFLVLAGSEVGFFEREVVNYSATTYGRRAGQRRLRPFRAHDVELFVPSWSAQDRWPRMRSSATCPTTSRRSARRPPWPTTSSPWSCAPTRGSR